MTTAVLPSAVPEPGQEASSEASSLFGLGPFPMQHRPWLSLYNVLVRPPLLTDAEHAEQNVSIAI